MTSIIVRESCLRLKCMSNSVRFTFFPVLRFYVLMYQFIRYTNFTHIAAGNTIVDVVAKQVTPTLRHQSCRILLFLVLVHFNVMEEFTVNDRFTPRLSKLGSGIRCWATPWPQKAMFFVFKVDLFTTAEDDLYSTGGTRYRR